jgi:small-conductance mechanosensitive channel
MRRTVAVWGSPRPAWAIAVLLAAVAAGPAAAQDDSLPRRAAPTAGAPVVLGRDTLFRIHSRLGPFSPEERARAVSERLARITDNRLAADTVSVSGDDEAVSVLVGDVVVTTVTEADALAAGISRDSLGAQRAAAVARALARVSVAATVKTILSGLAYTVVATFLLVLTIRLLNHLFPAAYARLETWRGTRIPTIRVQRLVLVTSGRATDVLLAGARGTRLALIAVLLLWYVPLVLNFFPWTEPYGDRFFEWILDPLRQMGAAALGYIPSLFYVAVIVAVTYYLLRFIRLFFDGLDRGTLVFPGFYAEWAIPTFKIARFLVLAFALVIIFPYLPGSGSDAFKGVSVFFGILLSLGSAGAIGNIVAGIVITYMRPFSLGDRVKIADTMGDVIERTLLVTRLRTSKHVEVSVPNAMVLSSHIINYSAAAKDGGVILHTGVTIGYDTPWRQVHELLLEAAARTHDLLAKPEPFVLQTALSDFSVAYEINAYTERPNRMTRIYSELHQHIQDAFQEAGVQIMSPNYEADPPEPKVPPRYAPKRTGPAGGD